MQIAIDIDGTITRYPLIFNELICLFRAGAHCVVILTGAAVPNPASVDRAALHTGRLLQLSPLLQEPIPPIEICVGRDPTEVADLKARFCLDHSIDLLIDDSKIYCDWVRSISPRTAVLMVYP